MNTLRVAELPDSTLPALGTRWPTGAHVVFDRPEGSAWYRIIHYADPVRVRTKAGVRRVGSGTCLITAPGTALWHRGASGGFLSDWVYFGGDSARELLELYGLPLDEPFGLREEAFIVPLLEEVRREYLERASFFRQAISNRLEELLRQLARFSAPSVAGATLSRSRHLVALAKARDEVLSRSHESWTVAQMASLVALSPSRFAGLYSETFQVSPLEDLIRTRIDKAKRLLAQGELSVERVAEEVAASSVVHFTRQFKQRVGVSPGRYGKQKHLIRDGTDGR